MPPRLLLLAALAALLSPAAPPAAPPNASDPAWTQLLSLAGTWQGTVDGKQTTVTYTVISGGHALLESMQMPAPQPDMVTVYHRDGNSLVATHYCSIGNQPRMRAPGLAPGGKSIRFRFADITNLAKPDAPHISHLTVLFEDANHFTQEWTSSASGKEEPAIFKWTRKLRK